MAAVSGDQGVVCVGECAVGRLRLWAAASVEVVVLVDGLLHIPRA